MTCIHCKRELTDHSNFCYYCGAPQSVAPSGPPPVQKRLMRSSVDSKIAGVCGGSPNIWMWTPPLCAWFGS